MNTERMILNTLMLIERAMEHGNETQAHQLYVLLNTLRKDRIAELERELTKIKFKLYKQKGRVA
jgi:hypothetical protein